jgi:hypothetical protein
MDNQKYNFIEKSFTVLMELTEQAVAQESDTGPCSERVHCLFASFKSLSGSMLIIFNV